MIVQRAHRNKNQRDNQIKVTTNWQYTQEPNQMFKRLMMLLLRSKDNKVRESNNESSH
jgi:hypothetical protein